MIYHPLDLGCFNPVTVWKRCRGFTECKCFAGATLSAASLKLWGNSDQ